MFQPSNLLTSRAAVGSVLAARTSTSAVVLASTIGTRGHDVSDEVIEGNSIVERRMSKSNKKQLQGKTCPREE